jgi:predicted TIM-barrel fold metal-dependent hydrolase
MDMEHMLAGNVSKKINEQHEELDLLVQAGEPIIPFIGTDPRQPDILEFVTKWHKRGFKGIKLYPPLGYYPNDVRLEPVYEYAIEHNLPVMTHCSRGGVHVKKVTNQMLHEPNPLGRKVVKKKAKQFSDIYTDPANYEPIATKYPDLKICLAHYGGGDEWDKYLHNPWDAKASNEDKSWLSIILDLMKKHDNIYADISSTLYHEEDRIDILKVLLENEKVRDRTLFGSDFYMMEREKPIERERSMKIRSQLGANLFMQIANTNVEKYLNA